ncbi:MobF family relaxase [Novosphingobium mathurense]|uniref:Conjugative relaxase domain-containing protein, TrwC/TraI family n=1 Tax=Novosphingobium mathurense TaxID=428990 RepID=A0A1U6IMC6_9SPHN|nr:MobF family relaxase [Novosphingobium mathurense]SLK09185.1 conjugative relaxase domain-containing protein, TrwC/TraI family [Novosphingobium mathurense]
MLSVATVKSAGGAAAYFGKDDYYTSEHSSELSAWAGKGAEVLGLSGEVTSAAFEAILNGELPDGTKVNQVANRQVGTDLTFSMPKSASVMAYVAGDKRILEAHLAAVKATMKWVEKTLAETRDYSRNRNGEPVKTGNLTYAIFQHDTSRKLDPQGHLHVVVAAITQTKDGKWQALWNSPLWKNNTLIGAAYHARMREELGKLGYQTEITGKHGQFEIKGVPANVLEAFSQRREEILAKAAQIGVSSPKGQDKVVVNTRDAKLNVEDRSALRKEWQATAAKIGFDGKDLIASALERSGSTTEKPIGFIARVHEIVSSVQGTIGAYFQPADPLLTNGLARVLISPEQLRTELAVASAIRQLGQREAAFPKGDILKTALNYGLQGVTIDRAEQRMMTLIEKGQLIPGASHRLDGEFTHITTPQHVAQERKLLAGIDLGRDASTSIMAGSDVSERLKAIPSEHAPSAEQLAATTLALSTSDRIVLIQGVAGAGKTTLISGIKTLAAEEGRETVGLAFANKMVSTLRSEAGIKAQTVSSFVNAHLKGALAGQDEAYEQSREELAGKVFVLDEASLVSNEAMNNLVTIANTFEVDRLIMVGDFKQLQSIDAGKAFHLVQSHEPAMATLAISQRQKTEHMQQVAALSRAGKFREAFEVLGPRVQSEGDRYLEKAADKWLALSGEERERTALYASGRLARRELNKLTQDGLKAEGSLLGEGLTLTTLEKVNTTREELRYQQTYAKGQVLEVARNTARNSRSGGLARGRYDVLDVNAKGQVILQTGKGMKFSFDPRKIDPTDKSDALQLYSTEQVTLYEGDRIIWGANDKPRGIDNADQARVLSITDTHVKVENSSGQVLEIDRSDKMLERLGLAYAINMHQAQGMTTDKGIGVLHSAETNLATQRLSYVMMTRVREDIEIVTNDSDRLMETISRNAGDKLSALEMNGEKVISNSASSVHVRMGLNHGTGGGAGLGIDPGKAGFSPTIPGELVAASKNDASLAAAGFAEHLKVGEPAKDVDLPERNIERSR